MAKVRVTVEFLQEGNPAMRWERTADTSRGGAYDLLGRAFEVVQREDDGALAPAMAAFMQGAVLGRRDIEDLLPELE